MCCLVAGCCTMLSAQCGWLLSCLVITLLQHRAQATTTSSTTTASSSTTNEQQSHPQKQQQTTDNQTAETDADTESEYQYLTCFINTLRFSASEVASTACGKVFILHSKVI